MAQQHQQQPPSDAAIRKLRHDAAMASRRARARRLVDAAKQPEDGTFQALAILSVLADGTVDFQCAADLAPAAEREILLGIRTKVDERLQQLQQGG